MVGATRLRVFALSFVLLHISSIAFSRMFPLERADVTLFLPEGGVDSRKSNWHLEKILTPEGGVYSRESNWHLEKFLTPEGDVRTAKHKKKIADERYKKKGLSAGSLRTINVRRGLRTRL